MPLSEEDYERLRSERVRRSTSPARTAGRSSLGDAIRSSPSARTSRQQGGGVGGRSLGDQFRDIAFDAGKGLIVGLPSQLWDNTVGNVGAVAAAAAGNTSGDTIRDDNWLSRALINEDLLDARGRGDGAVDMLRAGNPLLAPIAEGLAESGSRVGPALRGNFRPLVDDYSEANRDSRIVEMLVEDLGNAAFATGATASGAARTAQATRGARVARAGGATRAQAAREAVRAGRQSPFLGTADEAAGAFERGARRVARAGRAADDVLGRALLSPFTVPARGAAAAARTPAARAVRRAVGDRTIRGGGVGQRMADTVRARLLTNTEFNGENLSAAVRDRTDQGNKINAVRRSGEAISPAQRSYAILRGEDRFKRKKDYRSDDLVATADQAAGMLMANILDPLPVDLLAQVRDESAQAFTNMADELGVDADAFGMAIDHKLGRLDEALTEDISTAAEVRRQMSVEGQGYTDVMGETVPAGGTAAMVEGRGRRDKGTAEQVEARERAALLPELLPNDIDPEVARFERQEQALLGQIEQAQGKLQRITGRRTVPDEALTAPSRYQSRIFDQALGEARRLVLTRPDIAEMYRSTNRDVPLSGEQLLSAVTADIVSSRRMLEDVPEAVVQADPILQAASLLDRPLNDYDPRATSGLRAQNRRQGRSDQVREDAERAVRTRDEFESRARMAAEAVSPAPGNQTTLRQLAAAARQQVRAQVRNAKAQREVAKVEQRLAESIDEVGDKERKAYRKAVRKFRSEFLTGMRDTLDEMMADRERELRRTIGGNPISVVTEDMASAIEGAFRQAGVYDFDWSRMRNPVTGERLFRMNLSGRGRAVDDLDVVQSYTGNDLDNLSTERWITDVVGEIVAPYVKAKQAKARTGMIDNGFGWEDRWMMSSAEEASLLMGDLDELVDDWAQSEGRLLAEAREEAMWDEAVRRHVVAVELQAQGRPVRAAFEGASIDEAKALRALLAESDVAAATDRVDDLTRTAAARNVESGQVQGRREGRAIGQAEGRAEAARQTANRTRAGGRDLVGEDVRAQSRISARATKRAAAESRTRTLQREAARELAKKEAELLKARREFAENIAEISERITSAPARFRPAVGFARQLADTLDSIDPGAWADEYGLPRSLIEQIRNEASTSVLRILDTTDPTFLRGGPTDLISKGSGGSASPMGGASKVQSQRLKATGKVPFGSNEQAALALRDIRQQETNEVMYDIADNYGLKVDEQIAKYGVEGQELLEVLSAEHGQTMIGWNPDRLFPEDARGRDVRTVPDDAASRSYMDPDLVEATVIIPKWVAESFRYAASQDSALAQALIDKPTRVFKDSVLALSPRWLVGNFVSGSIMLHAAGVTAPDLVKYGRRAAQEMKKIRRGEQTDVLPRELFGSGYMAAEAKQRINADLAAIDKYADIDADQLIRRGKQGGNVVRRAGRKVVEGSYDMNTFTDDWYRAVAYLKMADDVDWNTGKLAYTKAEATKQALTIMGDYERMTPFERRVVRRVFPFYAWVRHITQLTHNLAVNDPTRIAWNLQLANAYAPEDELYESVPWLAGAVRVGDEYLNIGWMAPFATPAEMDLTNPTAIIGGNLNPIIGTALAATTGVDSSFGAFEQLRRPGVGFGETADKPPLFSDLGGTAYLVGRNLPQFRGAWNEIQRRRNGGRPVRLYDTGQRTEIPNVNATGTNNLGTVLNVPLPRSYNVRAILANQRD